jgi:hypothetical protein
MRAVAALTALFAVLASPSAGCAPTPKACDLSFAGITVEAGRVVDTVTVVCDLRPVEHVLQAWIEYKRFDEFDTYDRTSTTWDIPGSGRDDEDPADRPVRLTVSSPCVEGTYRTRAYARGKGPITESTPNPIPFEFEDTGWHKYVTAEDCVGGG